jgi:HAMP domain-containing protein
MKIGIASKINLLFFVGLLLAIFSVGIPAYLKCYQNEMEGVNFRLKSAVNITKAVFPFEVIPTYTADTPTQDPKYTAYWDRIRKIQKALNLRYIYVLRVNEDKTLQFMFDTGNDPSVVKYIDSNGVTQFKFSDFASHERRLEPLVPDDYEGEDDAYFKTYDDAPLEAHLASYSGKETFTETYQDKWGVFMSIFHPVFLNGKVIAVIGADIEVSKIQELKQKTFLLFALIVSFGLIIGFFVRKLIYYSFITPLLKLNEGSTKISQGDLDFWIEIDNKDEIGQLADNFNNMSISLKESFSKIKQYNEQLEEMVKVRTEELQNTLKEVQKLKLLQDGDYFLTTLITNPLMQNRNNLRETKTEFQMVQKKKFFFKGKEHQLGGDLCISGNLVIDDEFYTLVMNGDAMGKSMQGAGGALVAGSLLNSIISRQSFLSKSKSISPTKWLTQTFREMQNVMESFEGSMLVSLIIGLINVKTGRFLYINAEHPYPILYRDEKASFLHKSTSCYKIGFPDNRITKVFAAQILAGDVLLLGSDGRDDIRIKLSDGTSFINEDENLILSVVEDSKSDLRKIVSKLEEIGEITDDISLLKLTYLPN